MTIELFPAFLLFFVGVWRHSPASQKNAVKTVQVNEMVEKITIKKIKEKAHKEGLKIGDGTAREIKNYLNNRKLKIKADSDAALKMIFEMAIDSKRKTVKPRDLFRYKNFEATMNLGA